MRFDLDFDEKLLPSTEDMLRETSKNEDLQEIRLKTDEFNHILMCYLRSSLKEAYRAEVNARDPFPLDGSLEASSILVTEPRFMPFEIICLERYQEIVEQ